MSGWELSRLLKPEVAALAAYVPDQAHYDVRLDANEAPAFLSEAARRRLAELLVDVDLNRYPESSATELRAALAERTGVRPEQVVVGVGSDELITMLLTALARPLTDGAPPTVLTVTPTFVMYKLSAIARGFRVLEVPLDAEWDLAVPSLLKAAELNEPSLVFLATPNNPTGRTFSRARLEAVIEGMPRSLVIVDEAYIDYADFNHRDLLDRYPNVALLRTLSKVGFAALRVGWLAGSEELATALEKVRLPYNLPVPSQRLAVAALRELSDELATMCAEVKEERQRLAIELSSLPGIAVTASDANFLWVEVPGAAGAVFEALRARSVLVRSFHGRGGRLAHRLRITVGTQEENARLVSTLREVL